MSLTPTVALHFNPTDLNPQDLARTGQFLGSPARALEAGLGATRLMMVDQMKAQLAQTTGDITVAKLVDLADVAWQLNFWKFRKISAPVMADAYVRAYHHANAGDVPTSVIYDLADKHADRIGDYFHQSSKQAMVEGFNSYVNRRIASRAAAARVLEGYGLTPRQMGGYVSATASLDAKVSSREQRSLKAKLVDYVARSFRRRIKIFADQEAHNIDQQAQQLAWMWLVSKGRLSPAAEKVWITAKDEKVCKICGPLHGQKVGVNEQFHAKQGDAELAFWSPGVHPNCRCEVRLLENKFTITKSQTGVSKALRGGQLQQFNRKHPRDREGQFADIPDQPRAQQRTLVDPEWLKQVEAEIARQHEQEELPAWESSQGWEGGSWGNDWSGGWSSDRTSAEAPGPAQVRQRKPKKQKQKTTGSPQTQPQVAPEQWGQQQWSQQKWSEEQWGEQWSPETIAELKEQNPALTTEQLALNVMSFTRAVKEVTQAPEPVKTEELTRATRYVDDSPSAKASGSNLIYHFDPYEEVPEEEGFVEFTDDQSWLQGAEGGSELMRRAQVRVNNLIENDLDQIMSNPDHTYLGMYGDEERVNLKIPSETASALAGRDLGPGSKMLMVNSYELRQMLTAVANKTDDPPIESKTLWQAGGLKETPIEDVPISGHTLLAGLGITPEEFVQTIYVASEGYSGFDTGEGLEQVQADTGSAHGVWYNPGKFEIRDDSSRVTNQGPYRVVNVDPTVPVESIPINIEDLKRSQSDWL